MQADDGRGAVSRLSERWVRVGPAGRWAGFTLCGLVGLALALTWTLALAVAAGRPAWLVLVVAGGMLAGLVVAAVVEALVVGQPRLVCFHAELAAFTTATGALVLAEGVPAETFIDNVARLAFDNWAEHEAAGAPAPPIAEMALPRAKSARQVPQATRRRLAERAALLLGGETAAA